MSNSLLVKENAMNVIRLFDYNFIVIICFITLHCCKPFKLNVLGQILGKKVPLLTLLRYEENYWIPD